MTKSIRSRLQFWYGSILSVSMIVFGGLVYWRADRDMHERAMRQALTTADYLDLLLRPPGAGPGPGQGPGPGHGRGVNTSSGPLDSESGRTATATEIRPDSESSDSGRAAPPAGAPEKPDTLERDEDTGEPEWMRGGMPGSLIPPELLLTRPLHDGPPPTGARPMRGQPPGRMHRFPPPSFETLLRTDDGSPGLRQGPMVDRMDFVVWRADGSRLLASQGPGAEQLKSLKRPELATPGFQIDRQDQAIQVLTRGSRNSMILVHRPLQQDLRDLHWFGLCIAGLGAVTIVVGISGGHVLARRMVQPIAMISGIASQISVHHLNRRIDTVLLEQELVPLATVLNQTFERLEGSFRRLTQFTADASHELRTPLAVIQAQVELALGRRRSVEEYELTLQTCLKSAERMHGLVEGLLLLARSDSEHLDLQTQVLDLRTLVEDAVLQMQHTAAEQEIELDCVTPETKVSIPADPRFFPRIPLNLLENALQYTPRHGRISVSVSHEQDEAVLTIQDTGCGIPEALQSRIFDRFFRADTARSRRTGGNGLGLAICRSLVEAHQGRITCQSQPGQGTTMTVRLPRAPHSDRHPAGEPQTPMAGQSTNPDLNFRSSP